jgi:hypothetical protein
MRVFVARTRPSRMGRLILRRLFDVSHAKPRPHLNFPPAATPGNSPPVDGGEDPKRQP